LLVNWDFLFFGLQDQILKLNVRLRACNLLSNVDTFDSVMQELHDIGYGSDNGLKNLALIVSVTLLSIPVLAFKYIDFRAWITKQIYLGT